MKNMNIYILLALMAFALRMPAQTPSDIPRPDFRDRDVTYAPLVLLTTGSGRVFPLHDGQMLEVGRKYDMVAVPDRGFAFTNWNPVEVFTFIEYVYGPDGNLEGPVTNTVIYHAPEFTSSPVLRFTMQPVYVILDEPGAFLITISEGWQANFVPARRWRNARDW